MNPYESHAEAPARYVNELRLIEKGTLALSALAMFVGIGYVLLFPNPNSLSWERDLEIVAIVGLLILYVAVPVVGSLFLMRKGNHAGRLLGTLLASAPFFIVCGSFLSMLLVKK